MPPGDAVFLSLWLVWLVLSLGAYVQRVLMNSHPSPYGDGSTEI